MKFVSYLAVFLIAGTIGYVIHPQIKEVKEEPVIQDVDTSQVGYDTLTMQASFSKAIANSEIAGDVNYDGVVNVGDAVTIARVLAHGDVNNDCFITVDDFDYMINYLYRSGPAPQIGCVGKIAP